MILRYSVQYKEALTFVKYASNVLDPFNFNTISGIVFVIILYATKQVKASEEWLTELKERLRSEIILKPSFQVWNVLVKMFFTYCQWHLSLRKILRVARNPMIITIWAIIIT